MSDKEKVDVLLKEIQRAAALLDRYENVLEWVRHIAALHYFGNAFDPEHMRALSNMAADALSYEFKQGSLDEFEGENLPDFNGSIERSQAEAQRMANRLHRIIDQEFAPYYEESDDAEQVRED